MAKTIVSLYEDRAAATRAVSALRSAGFTEEHVRYASHEPGGPGEFEHDAATLGSADTLAGYGVAPDEAAFYADGLRRGGALVVVVTQDDDVESAVDLLAEHAPVRYEDRAGTSGPPHVRSA